MRTNHRPPLSGQGFIGRIVLARSWTLPLIRTSGFSYFQFIISLGFSSSYSFIEQLFASQILDYHVIGGPDSMKNCCIFVVFNR